MRVNGEEMGVWCELFFFGIISVFKSSELFIIVRGKGVVGRGEFSIVEERNRREL